MDRREGDVGGEPERAARRQEAMGSREYTEGMMRMSETKTGKSKIKG